jgi:pyruvate/2-oxoglutarate dehydrogenase complex dihydrolipoamide acyltransferase (E2) component
MNDGLFWAAKLVDGQLRFYRDAVSTPGAAIYWDAGIPYKYLKLDHGSVCAMSLAEIAAVDAAEAQAKADADAAQAAQAAADQTEATAAAQAREQAYLLAVQQIKPLAEQYRALLRKYFGEGAELNRTVTEESVFLYFNEFTKAETVTKQQTADAMTLKQLFDILAPLATDRSASLKNTWSLTFWSLI